MSEKRFLENIFCYGIFEWSPPWTYHVSLQSIEFQWAPLQNIQNIELRKSVALMLRGSQLIIFRCELLFQLTNYCVIIPHYHQLIIGSWREGLMKRVLFNNFEIAFEDI